MTPHSRPAKQRKHEGIAIWRHKLQEDAKYKRKWVKQLGLSLKEQEQSITTAAIDATVTREEQTEAAEAEWQAIWAAPSPADTIPQTSFRYSFEDMCAAHTARLTEALGDLPPRGPNIEDEPIEPEELIAACKAC